MLVAFYVTTEGLKMTDAESWAIANHRQRLVRIDSWLHGPADLFGECDKCHDNGALWVDLDTNCEGEFEYCRSCWKRRMENIRAAIARRLRGDV